MIPAIIFILLIFFLALLLGQLVDDHYFIADIDDIRNTDSIDLLEGLSKPYYHKGSLQTIVTNPSSFYTAHYEYKYEFGCYFRYEDSDNGKEITYSEYIEAIMCENNSRQNYILSVEQNTLAN